MIDKVKNLKAEKEKDIDLEVARAIDLVAEQVKTAKDLKDQEIITKMEKRLCLIL